MLFSITFTENLELGLTFLPALVHNDEDQITNWRFNISMTNSWWLLILRYYYAFGTTEQIGN